jgi:hypothetical protein
MITYLNSIGIGSNGYVTTTEAASATTVANSTNTTVTKFNELRYFTSITQSISNTCKFSNWTALEEIDISNFTSLGNISTVMSDTFSGCTSLKTVTASNNLTSIGYAAFKNCSNLEDVTGLNGTITTGREAFYGCKKLKSSNF